MKNNWKLPEGHVTPNLAFFQAGVTGGIFDHPAVVNFMKRKGGQPEKIQLEQLTSNPDSAVTEYLKKEIHA